MKNRDTIFMDQIVRDHKEKAHTDQEDYVPCNFLIHDFRPYLLEHKIESLRKNGKVKDSKLTDVNIADLMM